MGYDAAHGSAHMFEVKLLESVQAFVHFFVLRLLIAFLTATLFYKMTGSYYFELLVNLITTSPISDIDLGSYIEKTSEYLSGESIKNTIFIVALIVSLSLLDIVYRIVGGLGRLLPITFLYNYNKPIEHYLKSAEFSVIFCKFRLVASASISQPQGEEEGCKSKNGHRLMY
jgi:hypothetical protein